MLHYLGEPHERHLFDVVEEVHTGIRHFIPPDPHNLDIREQETEMRHQGCTMGVTGGFASNDKYFFPHDIRV